MVLKMFINEKVIKLLFKKNKWYEKSESECNSINKERFQKRLALQSLSKNVCKK